MTAYIKILQYDEACKVAEGNTFKNIQLDPKVKTATAYAIKNNGFIRQTIIGGAANKASSAVKIYAFDTDLIEDSM
jgi:hypothetical protein